MIFRIALAKTFENIRGVAQFSWIPSKNVKNNDFQYFLTDFAIFFRAPLRGEIGTWHSEVGGHPPCLADPTT